MRNPDIGALVDFIGLVRNNGDTDDVVALNLEHYRHDQAFALG
ncbi:MAG: molybdenum cofactor biosynthesis protein MoaE, partial [Paraburkholderia tropica]